MSGAFQGVRSRPEPVLREGAVVKSYPTDRIRNVVLLGHGGAGKTSVTEALLARAGAIARAGKVDDGTSVLDTEADVQGQRHRHTWVR